MDIAVFSLVNHFEISVFSQIYHEQISKGGWNQMRTLNYRIRNWRVINLEPGWCVSSKNQSFALLLCPILSRKHHAQYSFHKGINRPVCAHEERDNDELAIYSAASGPACELNQLIQLLSSLINSTGTLVKVGMVVDVCVFAFSSFSWSVRRNCWFRRASFFVLSGAKYLNDSVSWSKSIYAWQYDLEDESK
jgi:hypothetical protein